VPGTYGSGAKSNKIDYILLSPALWAPRTSPHFTEISSAVEAASDHAAMWVDRQ